MFTLKNAIIAILLALPFLTSGQLDRPSVLLANDDYVSLQALFTISMEHGSPRFMNAFVEDNQKSNPSSHYLTKSLYLCSVHGLTKAREFLDASVVTKEISQEEADFTIAWVCHLTARIYERDAKIEQLAQTPEGQPYEAVLSYLRYQEELEEDRYFEDDEQRKIIRKKLEQNLEQDGLDDNIKHLNKLSLIGLKHGLRKFDGNWKKAQAAMRSTRKSFPGSYDDRFTKQSWDGGISYSMAWRACYSIPSSNPTSDDLASWEVFEPYFLEHPLRNGLYTSEHFAGFSIFDYPVTNELEIAKSALDVLEKAEEKYPAIVHIKIMKTMLIGAHFDHLGTKEEMAFKHLDNVLSIYELHSAYGLGKDWYVAIVHVMNVNHEYFTALRSYEDCDTLLYSYLTEEQKSAFKHRCDSILKVDPDRLNILKFRELLNTE